MPDTVPPSPLPLPAGHIRVGGAPEGFDARVLLKELEAGKPVVHVARDHDPQRVGGFHRRLHHMYPRERSFCIM